MASDNIESKVCEIVALQLSLNDEDISSNSSFIEDLGADSLDIMEVVMALEEEFGLDIPDNIFHQFITIQDAICYLKEKIG